MAPVPIRLSFGGQRGPDASRVEQAVHWANIPRGVVRVVAVYTLLGANAPERKARVLEKIGMESSATREYPSLIHTFFLTHTIGGKFVNPEDKPLYDEMLRLQGLGSNTSSGVPYTEDEIMAIVRRGKQRGHIPGVGRILPGRARSDDKFSQMLTQLESHPEYGGGSGSGG
ncbi:hypothetical protein Tco_0873160 [Tanacetum coccineum]